MILLVLTGHFCSEPDPQPMVMEQVASVLYLDSPAGVVRMHAPAEPHAAVPGLPSSTAVCMALQGLSYSEDASDYATTDTVTARDSYAFLQQFFQLFKDFAGLPFYITGAMPI